MKPSRPVERRLQRPRRVSAPRAAALVAFALAVAACTQTQSASERRAPVATVDAGALEADVRRLASDFHPRDFRHPENLDRAAAWIGERFAHAGGEVGAQVWDTDGAQYRNVTALFGPETAERIVIGAHYDTCDPLPGADDNASGVAGLLELARLLGLNPPPLRVELVAYSLEEPPYFRTPEMGSAKHARALGAGRCARARDALARDDRVLQRRARQPAARERADRPAVSPTAGTSSCWSATSSSGRWSRR